MVKYTVQQNDSLSTIAGRFGTTWEAIYEANRAKIGSNPNLIQVGMVLDIPAASGQAQSGGGTGSGAHGPDKGPMQYANGTFNAPYYTVAAGDVLSGIGQRFNVAWQEIAKANSISGDVIKTGERLRIPGWK